MDSEWDPRRGMGHGRGRGREVGRVYGPGEAVDVHCHRHGCHCKKAFENSEVMSKNSKESQNFQQQVSEAKRSL